MRQYWYFVEKLCVNVGFHCKYFQCNNNIGFIGFLLAKHFLTVLVNCQYIIFYAICQDNLCKIGQSYEQY